MQTLKLIDLQILIYILCFILHNGLPKLDIHAVVFRIV